MGPNSTNLKSWWFGDFNTFAFITVLICNSLGLNNFDNLFFFNNFLDFHNADKAPALKIHELLYHKSTGTLCRTKFPSKLTSLALVSGFLLTVPQDWILPNIQSTAKSLNSVHSLLGIPITTSFWWFLC